jgi:hypothetical protein
LSFLVFLVFLVFFFTRSFPLDPDTSRRTVPSLVAMLLLPLLLLVVVVVIPPRETEQRAAILAFLRFICNQSINAMPCIG